VVALGEPSLPVVSILVALAPTAPSSVAVASTSGPAIRRLPAVDPGLCSISVSLKKYGPTPKYIHVLSNNVVRGLCNFYS
jgi:hypothetical protein